MSDRDIIHRWLTQAELDDMMRQAFVRGAASMREAAAGITDTEPDWLVGRRLSSLIRDLPIPEDKP